jgi:uncharacterized membrane protein YgdD (TMEM256/DUF423 family)
MMKTLVFDGVAQVYMSLLGTAVRYQLGHVVDLLTVFNLRRASSAVSVTVQKACVMLSYFLPSGCYSRKSNSTHT